VVRALLWKRGTMNRLAVIALSLASFAACSSNGDFTDAAAEAEGIYKVTVFTHNQAACTPGGDSALGAETFAFAATHEFLGITVLDLFSCDDPTDCRSKLAALDSGGSFGLDFNFSLSGVQDGVLVSEGASSGFSDDGTCRDGSVTRTRLAVDAGGLRLQQEITVSND
jgi:hypothetical protein